MVFPQHRRERIAGVFSPCLSDVMEVSLISELVLLGDGCRLPQDVELFQHGGSRNARCDSVLCIG